MSQLGMRGTAAPLRRLQVNRQGSGRIRVGLPARGAAGQAVIGPGVEPQPGVAIPGQSGACQLAGAEVAGVQGPSCRQTPGEGVMDAISLIASVVLSPSVRESATYRPGAAECPPAGSCPAQARKPEIPAGTTGWMV